MFKTILVPLDLTDKHREAIATAAELAKQSGGEVTLLHVIEVIHGLSLEDEPKFYSRLERKADAHLDRCGAPLTEQKVAWQRKVLYGHRDPEILRYATETAADLIVLTTPRFDPNHVAASLDSASWRLSILAPCRVLLVKEAAAQGS
jgi:nucleotide-binding universal stress UspA family protein